MWAISQLATPHLSFNAILIAQIQVFVSSAGLSMSLLSANFHLSAFRGGG